MGHVDSPQTLKEIYDYVIEVELGEAASDNTSLGTLLLEMGAALSASAQPAPPQPVDATATATQALTSTGAITTYASLPTPLVRTLTIPADEPSWNCLFSICAYIDTSANNIEVALALDISGAVSIPAGSRTADRLHVVGKQPIGATMSITRGVILPSGTMTIEVMYAATGAANVSDIAIDLIPVSVL